MTYSIRLPQEIEKRLEVLSLRTGRSKSFYVKEATLEHLSDIEDIYLAEKRLEDIYLAEKRLEDIYLAEKRLEDIYAGRTKTIPLQEVMKKYGKEVVTERLENYGMVTTSIR